MESLIIAISAVVAFTVTAVMGKFLIPVLTRIKFGQTIREVGPSWHMKKQGTPTMGGLMFIIGSVVAVSVGLSLSFHMLGGESVLLTTRVIGGLLMAIVYGAIGFVDDYISVKKKRNLGLTEIQKLIMQFVVAFAYLLSVHFAGGTTETFIPLVGIIDLGFAYYILAAIIIVGMVNAVNFSDGVDGLCSTVTFFATVSLMICAFLVNYMGSAILAVTIAGACLGFLVWNFNPAKVFMGDTGSLFLGGAVCAIAFSINMPILLLLVGIIYIFEMASVILQVAYFKITKGKRLFKMAPVHHHFEMLGWSEMKICAIFGIVTAVCGLISIIIIII